jgi:hypothetical protein
MKREIEPIILRPKKSSAFGMLFACVAFVALCISMAVKTGSWIGYAGAAFFSLGIPVGVILLLPGSAYLRIAEDGLSFASLFRVTKLPWEAIDRFYVLSMKANGLKAFEMVCFDFVPSYQGQLITRRISTAVAGCEAGLPCTYGKKAEELAEILNRCLETFTDRHRSADHEPAPPNSAS